MSLDGKVSLVGAGCGDYDLITVRGMRLLSECDVVIYDALIDTRLLSFAKNAEKINVGKRAGKHSETQEEINSLLIKKAKEGKKVVRLKGGDPFVFGRGSEEAIALMEADIEFEAVPGISSAIAAAETAGIPVTHRNLSRSFEVITASTSQEEFTPNYFRLASSDGTLIFMMGLKKISEIANKLILNGMDKNTPSAVISNGATSRQKTIRSPLCDIEKALEKNKPEAPAIFVVGKTAELNLKMQAQKKLTGVSICVVGTQSIVKRLSILLEKDGAMVFPLPCLEIIKKQDSAKLKTALQEIEQFGCIAFTSANGVDVFFEALAKENIDLRKLNGKKIAAIGNGTAKAIRKYGIIADIVPNTHTSKDLANLLCELFDKNEKILIARAEDGSKELTKILDSNKMCYEDIKIYEARILKLNPPDNCDYYVFSSAKGVRAFFEIGGKIDENSDVICIGCSTQKELEKHGAKNIKAAKHSSIESIESTILLKDGKEKDAKI